MESKSNKKLIICTRHGERTDHVGLIPSYGPCDPELTENGCQQAYLMGQILSKEISEFTKDQKGKILILSSPFVRTLQTSRGLLSGLVEHDNNSLGIQKEIHVDHLLSEYIKKELIEILPVNYLNLYNNCEFLQTELPEYSLNFLNMKELLPVELECKETCHQRMKKCVENVINDVLKMEDVKVVILVSHGTPIDNINKILGYPGPYGWKNINYCNSYFYLHDTDLKSTEFLYLKKLD